MIILLFFILCFTFIRYFWNWRPEPWPNTFFNLPPLQVHRGYWKSGLQENTLSSFREARRLGAQMIELDVQLAKDGVPVVFHDHDLSRFCNDPSMKNLRVRDLNSAELNKWVHAPTLEDVLHDSESPSFINIEIKSNSFKSNGLEEKVSEIVKESGAQKRVIFSSFNPFSLMRLSRLLPEVPRALLASNDKSDPDNKIYLRQMWFGGIAKAHMVNLDYKMFTSFLRRRLEERKIPVAVWTVNDATRASLLRNQGVVSIITDTYPLDFT